MYFDLATWHLINTVYAAGRISELRQMKICYADLRQHARLMGVDEHRLGQAEGGSTRIDLSMIEAGLERAVQKTETIDAIASYLAQPRRLAHQQFPAKQL